MYQNELSRLLSRAKEIVTQKNRCGDASESTGDRLHDKNRDRELAKKIRPYGSSQSHWFDGNSPQDYIKKQKVGSDSWYRLQAFIQSHSDDELQAMDPTWTRET